MKHINETFEDKEYEELLAKKKASGKTWHDFILNIPNDSEKSKDTNTENFKTAKVTTSGTASISRTLAGQIIEYRLKQ